MLFFCFGSQGPAQPSPSGAPQIQLTSITLPGYDLIFPAACKSANTLSVMLLVLFCLLNHVLKCTYTIPRFSRSSFFRSTLLVLPKKNKRTEYGEILISCRIISPYFFPYFVRISIEKFQNTAFLISQRLNTPRPAVPAATFDLYKG